MSEEADQEDVENAMEWVDHNDLESPNANQYRRELVQSHIKNSDEPDELMLSPVDADGDEFLTKWVSASGQESFVALKEMR